jgi:hypothetical protein
VKISVYNQAVTPLGLDLAAYVAAMQEYADKFVGPVWGVSAELALTQGPVAGTVGFIFLDDADSPGALAYHTVEDGLPLIKVFVRTVLNAKESLSVSGTHELAETLVDPATSLTATRKDGSVYAYEVGDPVEETTFKVLGFDMSDFVWPAYFEEFHKPDSVPFDQCGVLHAPFTLAVGGYQSMQPAGGGDWTDVFGSMEKKRRFLQEDRRGHRSEYRKCITRR